MSIEGGSDTGKSSFFYLHANLTEPLVLIAAVCFETETANECITYFRKVHNVIIMIYVTTILTRPTNEFDLETAERAMAL